MLRHTGLSLTPSQKSPDGQEEQRLYKVLSIGGEKNSTLQMDN